MGNAQVVEIAIFMVILRNPERHGFAARRFSADLQAGVSGLPGQAFQEAEGVCGGGQRQGYYPAED